MAPASASAYVKPLIIVAVFIAGFYLLDAYELVTIPDDAVFMDPAVRARSTRLFRTVGPGSVPGRGAIVWFEPPASSAAGGGDAEAVLISRVVALPGDRVALKDGKLRIDGKERKEPYAPRRLESEEIEEVIVPAGHVYVLNDAGTEPRSSLTDSRRLGPIPLALVRGTLGGGEE